jgi:hypothetical protein
VALTRTEYYERLVVMIHNTRRITDAITWPSDKERIALHASDLRRLDQP